MLDFVEGESTICGELGNARRKAYVGGVPSGKIKILHLLDSRSCGEMPVTFVR